MCVAIEYAYGIVADYIWLMTHSGIFSPSSEKRYTSVIFSTFILEQTIYMAIAEFSETHYSFQGRRCKTMGFSF